MNEFLDIILVMAAGTALGAVFYGGLRWTVSNGLNTSNPALWFSSSFIIRFAITIGGFYFIAHYHYAELLQFFCAFALVSLAVCRPAQPKPVSVKTTED